LPFFAPLVVAGGLGCAAVAPFVVVGDRSEDLSVRGEEPAVGAASRAGAAARDVGASVVATRAVGAFFGGCAAVRGAGTPPRAPTGAGASPFCGDVLGSR